MSISQTQGIFNFSKMKDADKAYLVKLLGTIIAATTMGFVSGIFYPDTIDGITSGRLGFFVWFLVTLGLTYWIKYKYDLSDWNDKRIFRHGVFIGFFHYLFWWSVWFNIVRYSF